MNTGKKDLGINGITEGVIWKQLLLFFYPLLIGTFFETLYSTVDAIVVGQYAGKLALSAVGGSSAILINLIVGFFIGVSAGSTVVIAQCFGAKDDEGVSRAVHSSVAIAVAGGAVISLFILLVAPNLLEIMKTPAETLELSRTYLTVAGMGMIPVMIFNMCSGILRAIGDSKTPTYVLIVCCIINIGLDLLFVRGFGWSVAGTAAATIISQTVSAAILIVILMRDRGPCRLYLSRVRFYGAYVKKILFIGIPSGIRSTMYSISNVFIQVGINELGTNNVAAWTAYSKIDLIYWMIIMSMGTALTTFAGQNFGAQKYNRIRKGIRQAGIMMVMATVAYNVILLPVCGYIFRMFT
ncbi:MAG: MATE family efflux transporter [Lachnospiraceae bacterium]|nr:MATE family efflux transporter [Lachnospiraceae bacterium]